jgi:hypothetical protein
VIEVGVPWIRVDAHARLAHEAFRKNEERLQNMEMRPSEYVRRQCDAISPRGHGLDDRNAGAEVCMFSSDFLHVEGGATRSGVSSARSRRYRRRCGLALLLGQLRRHAAPVLERRGVPTAVNEPWVRKPRVSKALCGGSAERAEDGAPCEARAALVIARPVSQPSDVVIEHQVPVEVLDEWGARNERQAVCAPSVNARTTG